MVLGQLDQAVDELWKWRFTVYRKLANKKLGLTTILIKYPLNPIAFLLKYAKFREYTSKLTP